MWSGYVKGWEVTLLDAVAVGLILGTHGRWPRLTLTIPILAYLTAVVIAVHQARFGSFAISYVFQLVRVLFVFLAVSRVVEREQGERAVLTGLVVGLTVQAAYAILARASGILQSGGSLGHQNLLGFVSHLVILPAFAMLLARRWHWVAWIGMLAGIIAVILTVSRAALVFSMIGLALTLVISITGRFTARKALVGMVSILLLASIYPLARSGLERRFELQRTTFFAEDKERDAFERAALAMLAANPNGVGPNHYVFIANTEGFSSRAGVSWASGSRSTNVHNSFLLVAAETGYLGVLTMILLLSSAVWRALSTARRFRRQPGAEVLIGVGCGILALSLHGLYEWMFVALPAQYLLAVSFGLISGLRSRFLRHAVGSSYRARAIRQARGEYVPDIQIRGIDGNTSPSQN